MKLNILRQKLLQALPDDCCKKDCNGKAEFLPVLLIWALGDWKRRDNACIRMEMGLGLCQYCARVVKVENLLDDSGWAQIYQAITGAGRAEPNRDSVRLELKPIVRPERN